MLTVEVRVGSYAFDNTNFLGDLGALAGAIRQLRVAALPLDDNYQELRRHLWLATDDAYKSALEQLAAKQTALRNRTRSDTTPDFSHEAVVAITDTVSAANMNRGDAETFVRGLSALFRNMPDIFDSGVAWSAQTVRTRYVNSEGTSYLRVTPRVTLRATASTQAADGASIADDVAAYGPSAAGIPGRDEFAARIREMGERVAKLRHAAAAESYDGPVLFEGQAAAVLFNEIFAPRLIASRRPATGSPFMDQFAARSDNPFTDLIGKLVLPRFLSVVNDPTKTSYQGQAIGGYRVDDDGVPAREIALVDRGTLKTLLSTLGLPVLRHQAKRRHSVSTACRWRIICSSRPTADCPTPL